MFGLITVITFILAGIAYFKAGIAYFKDRINDLCWWSFLVLFNLNIGLFAIIMERLN